jgi:hypothetical protein
VGRRSKRQRRISQVAYPTLTTVIYCDIRVVLTPFLKESAMLKLEEQELLQRYAYQAWLERGKPIGSPEVDWEKAKAMLHAHYSQGLKALDDAAVERMLLSGESLSRGNSPETQIVDSHLVRQTTTPRKSSRRPREQ